MKSDGLCPCPFPFPLAVKNREEKLFQMSSVGVSQVLRLAATVAATFLGGSFAIGFLSSSISDRITSCRKKKYGRPCWTCKAIGHYTCKLCKGNGTISWSPLYDPVFINPCVCPTCDGFKVQRCLNCLGYGSM